MRVSDYPFKERLARAVLEYEPVLSERMAVEEDRSPTVWHVVVDVGADPLDAATYTCHGSEGAVKLAFIWRLRGPQLWLAKRGSVGELFTAVASYMAHDAQALVGE